MSHTIKELWCSLAAFPTHCHVQIPPTGGELPGRQWPAAGAGTQLPASLQSMLASLTLVDEVRT